MRTPGQSTTNPSSVSPIERIAGYHWEHLNRQPSKPRPADPESDWCVWFTKPGSDELYRVCEFRKPRAWKTRTGADRFARQSMAPSSPLGRSLEVEAVYVGTAANPRFARVH